MLRRGRAAVLVALDAVAGGGCAVVDVRDQAGRRRPAPVGDVLLAGVVALVVVDAPAGAAPAVVACAVAVRFGGCSPSRDPPAVRARAGGAVALDAVDVSRSWPMCCSSGPAPARPSWRRARGRHCRPGRGRCAGQRRPGGSCLSCGCPPCLDV
jgi:hypothetical protein